MTTLYLVFECQSQGVDSICGLFSDLESAREAILKYIGSGKYTQRTSFNKEFYYTGEHKYKTLYIDFNERILGQIF